MNMNRMCLLIASLLIVVIACHCRAENRTTIISNARRFEKILHRKRRFLLFPPGAAIVTTLSFTKTLVPRSPSGINMIAECDVFYPLQNKISDWYPTTKPPPPPPPPPEDDYEDDAANMADDAMMAPNQPPPQSPAPQPQPQPQPPPPPMNDIPAPPPPTPTQVGNGQQIPDNVNGQFRFPTDQELGINAGTLINDPNFNVGKHPGEIYVENGMSTRRRDPTGAAVSSRYKNRKKVASFSMHEDYLWKNMNNGAKNYWHPPQPFPESNKRRLNRFPYDRIRKEHIRDRYTAIRQRRGAKERRDLYEQLERFAMFKNVDPKACVLRIICETKHYLLPPGKSLFQDIFRVLFTLPDEANEYDDEYIQAMRSDENECRTEYAKKCRYSILGYLLSPERPIL